MRQRRKSESKVEGATERKKGIKTEIERGKRKNELTERK